MTGFSIDWLNLREGADGRARNDKLLEHAKHWLHANGKNPKGIMVVDLGAGTGSTLRAFGVSPMNSGAHALLHWHLVDQDPSLLAEAKLRHGASHQIQTHELDLADIKSLPLDGARLVTASALFDLVSAKFIDELAAALKNQSDKRALGLYSALNYDGTTRWTPVHPLDASVLSAFNRDQQRDKGFGEALGPDAGLHIKQRFSSLGFKVLSANSPWVLGGADKKLVEALITGIGDAVAQDPALQKADLRSWIKFRQSHAASGTCTVGHTDLLVLPDTLE
jgi:hypothetical protein